MPVNCTTDAEGCIVCPAITASPGSTSSSVLLDNLGWNAGGDSTDALDGNLHFVFTMAKVVGAVTGFKPTRDSVGSPQAITHGFGFQSSGGTLLWFIAEQGVVVNHGGSYTTGDSFEIRRFNDHVTYYHAGIKVYTSSRLSTSELIVGGCLYAASDAITETVFESFTLVDGDGSAVLPKIKALGWKGKLATMALPVIGIVASGHDAAHVSIPLPPITAQAWNGNIGSAALPAIGASGWSFQEPTISLGFATMPQIFASAAAHRIVSAEPVIELPPIGALGFKGKWASIEMPVIGVSGDNHDPFATGIFLAFQTPGLVIALGDTATPAMTFNDELVGSVSVLDFLAGFSFNDRLNATTVFDSPGSMRKIAISDTLVATDITDIVQYMILNASVAAVGSLDLTKSMLLAFADALAATDDLIERRDALMIIASAAAMSSSGGPFSIIDVAENAALTDELIARAMAILQMTDTLDATDSVSGLLSLVMVFNDNLEGDDVLTQFRHALMSIEDTLFVGGTFTFGGVDYVIYAMQPVGAAISDYTNFNFDSGFTLDGVAYVTGASGVFVHEGQDDDGTPIDASLYTGLSTLGTSMTKDSVELVIGYTGAGSLMLKVYTTTKQGKKENTYKLTPTTRAGTTNARFTPSKGLHSQYFGFGLENVDGGDFDVDYMKVWARALNRRV